MILQLSRRVQRKAQKHVVRIGFIDTPWMQVHDRSTALGILFLVLLWQNGDFLRENAAILIMGAAA